MALVSWRRALLLPLLLGALAPVWAAGSRIKDVAALVGLGRHKLLGYGLVVGLEGTGDSSSSLLTARSIANMLETFGVTVQQADFKATNVAAVMVTGELPPVAAVGATLDVTVSSLADARSLQGGTLLLTPLRAADSDVYAVAQGPLTVGGFSAGGKSGDTVQKNHVTVGRVPGGASVVKALQAQTTDEAGLRLALLQPDYTTACRVVEAINGSLGEAVATAPDAATVLVTVPAGAGADLSAFIARLESLPIQPDLPARVVINERTGTVVIGSRVRLAPVAICHGGLTVEIKAETQVSQPPPLVERTAPAAPGADRSLTGGQTVTVRQEDVQVRERSGQLAAIPEQTTLDDLVKALNALHVKPRDLIAILQALKEAGALQAELVLF